MLTTFSAPPPNFAAIVRTVAPVSRSYTGYSLNEEERRARTHWDQGEKDDLWGFDYYECHNNVYNFITSETIYDTFNIFIRITVSSTALGRFYRLLEIA